MIMIRHFNLIGHFNWSSHKHTTMIIIVIVMVIVAMIATMTMSGRPRHLTQLNFALEGGKKECTKWPNGHLPENHIYPELPQDMRKI